MLFLEVGFTDMLEISQNFHRSDKRRRIAAGEGFSPAELCSARHSIEIGNKLFRHARESGHPGERAPI
jgi:hypothetical protein